MEHVLGLQHIGLPTRDMARTLAFYEKLGFRTAYRTLLDGEPVVFLTGYGLTLEAYQTPEATLKSGAIDHIALNVDDIDAAWREVTEMGFTPIDPEIHFLPFWEKGVKFFIILGPNAERVEFNQILA